MTNTIKQEAERQIGLNKEQIDHLSSPPKPDMPLFFVLSWQEYNICAREVFATSCAGCMNVGRKQM